MVMPFPLHFMFYQKNVKLHMAERPLMTYMLCSSMWKWESLFLL